MKRTVKTYSISWTADHEQYYQGHGVAFTDFEESVTGCGSTLQEAFDDALEMIAQQEDSIDITPELGSNLKTLLIGEIRNGRESVLSIDIADKRFGYCTSRKTAKHKEDCSVCGGEWYFYVSIDYTLQDEPLPETSPIQENAQ